MTYDKNSIVFVPLSTHPLFLNLTDKQFGRLTVLGYAGRKNNTLWFCECTCGTITRVLQTELTNGSSRSCGCLRTEITVARNLTHGESGVGKRSVEYGAYAAARSRCNNPNGDDFPQYGGRGIEFRFESFEQFLAELGRRPSPKHSLDRKNVDGHYEPGNVRWSVNQNRNRTNNRNLTFRGKTKCVAEWAEITGIHRMSITKRLKRGWCVKCTLTLARLKSCFHKKKC